MIARVGDELDVSDDPGLRDYRTIRELNLIRSSTNDAGNYSGFNDLKQIAFRAEFTDGTSGIFVSNLVAVPEPCALALIITALAATAHFASRRERQQSIV